MRYVSSVYGRDFERRVIMTEQAQVVAQRISQDGVTMYVTALDAGTINRFGVVDTWKPYLPDVDDDQGYQRAVVTAHAKRIAKFLLDEDQDRLMPTAILLSSRKPLRFESLGLAGTGSADVGIL